MKQKTAAVGTGRHLRRRSTIQVQNRLDGTDDKILTQESEIDLPLPRATKIEEIKLGGITNPAAEDDTSDHLDSDEA